MQKIIKQYLRCLEVGDSKRMLDLFTKDAIINSPLYGKIKASKFYPDLFKDTQKSKITLLDILQSKKLAAGFFRYDWVLKNGTPTSFLCVDVFSFDKNLKIKELTIIYDTAKIRSSFNKMKS